MATVHVVSVPSIADLNVVTDCVFVLACCGCFVASANAADVSAAVNTVGNVVVAVVVGDDASIVKDVVVVNAVVATIVADGPPGVDEWLVVPSLT